MLLVTINEIPGKKTIKVFGLAKAVSISYCSSEKGYCFWKKMDWNSEKVRKQVNEIREKEMMDLYMSAISKMIKEAESANSDPIRHLIPIDSATPFQNIPPLGQKVLG